MEKGENRLVQGPENVEGATKPTIQSPKGDLLWYLPRAATRCYGAG